MEQTLTALHRFLSARPGFEAVLIAPTLSMGRQLLDACAARFGGVLGVRVHTPDTLALELCGADCPGILPHDAGAFLILSLLREKGASWPFFSDLGMDHVTLSAARALLEDLLLLEREGKCLPAGQEDPRLAGLSALWAAYREEKERRGLWDRYDLFAHAAGRLKEKPPAIPMAICANSTGEGIVQSFLKGLNAEVLPVPCAWEAPPVPALFLPQTVSAPAARLRFVRGYGQENEALFPFYDMLECRIPFGQAAILCAGRDTLPLLREQAARLGIPLTLDGGVPLEKGALLPLLRALASWYGGGCPVEGLPGLMAGGLAVPHGAAFLKYLRENHVGGRLSRYLDCLERKKKKYLAGSPDEQLLSEHNDWIAFCGEIGKLFAETATVEEGLALLRSFLQARYVKSQVRAQECAALLSALENLAGYTPGGSFLALLPELLDAVSRPPWQSAAPRDGAVHAAPLSKGAFLGRSYTYILGLDRNALTAPGRESPLLRDEERSALGLPGSDSGAELPAYHLVTALAAGGEVTLSYSCFDTEKMLAAPPSPIYERLRGTTEPVFFGYHRSVSLTGADRWLEGNGSPAPVIGLTAGKAGLPEDFVFSASSLETAMGCPRRFYFQYILKIPQVEKTDLAKRGWLPVNVFGSLVHEVLEDYFDRLIRDQQAPDFDSVCDLHLNAYEQIWPCADQALQAREARRARDCAHSAVEYFRQKGGVPLATELAFGRDTLKVQPSYSFPEKFTLQLDEELSFPFTGSIDRLDRLPGGEELAIFDYKTGARGMFLRESDNKLQYYLYARAAEQLGLGRVMQAVYLFLTPAGAQPLDVPDPGEDTECLNRVKTLVKLLREGRAADIAQPAWQDTVPVCGSDDKDRQNRLKACANYCPYAALCQEA